MRLSAGRRPRRASLRGGRPRCGRGGCRGSRRVAGVGWGRFTPADLL